MCSIFGAFNKETFIKLAQLNQSRGQFSHSITVYDPKDNKIISCHKAFNELSNSSIPPKENKRFYYIGHVQAPTNGLVTDPNKIHPSIEGETFLWHNGIIKSNSIKRLQDDLNMEDEKWDTKLLHHSILKYGLRTVNDIDGTFGCFYIDKGSYIFTTPTINLFVNKEMDVSSVPFNGAEKIDPNTIFRFDLKEKILKEKLKFNSISDPYFFAE